MKKISYYVAAFALCCGVSQTLTSCIEETEEPDDVKALRQAEIAKVNADAEYKKAQAASETATAALTNAQVDGQKIDNAIKELQKALREGVQADSIAYYAASVQSAIKKSTNTDIENAKTLAEAFLTAKLNSDCPSYFRYSKANAILNGGTYEYLDYSGNITTATIDAADAKAQKLADAQADFDNGVDQLKAHLNFIAKLQTEVSKNDNALKLFKNKTRKDYEADYKDDKDVQKANSNLTDIDWTNTTDTYKKSDDDGAQHYADAQVALTYQQTLLENNLKAAEDKLALANDNKAFDTNSAYEKLYDALQTAQANFDNAKAELEAAKALYEEELAAIKAVNK